jgi:hypothetical protein
LAQINSDDDMPLIVSMTGSSSCDLADNIVQPVIGDRADNRGVGTMRDAVLNLRDLLVELGIAAGFHKVHLDAQALGLLGRAAVDAQPIGVPHVRERNADLPLLGRILERHVGDVGRLAVGSERRIDLSGLIGEPFSGARRSSDANESRRKQRTREIWQHDDTLLVRAPHARQRIFLGHCIECLI